jgi:hypothetical protein
MTEEPHWLDEAYSKHLAALDTGAAARVIDNASTSLFIAMVVGAKGWHDFGGGDGLFARILRDKGVDCRPSDVYAHSTYAQGFEWDGSIAVDVVSAFEVIEHFSEPARELRCILSTNARVVVLQTGIYTGQGKDWWYLAPESGQHIFFYSRRSLEHIATEYHYRPYFWHGYTIFARDGTFSRLKSRVTYSVLSPRFRRLLVAWAMARKNIGTWPDHISARDVLNKSANPRSGA